MQFKAEAKLVLNIANGFLKRVFAKLNFVASVEIEFVNSFFCESF